MVWQVKRIHWKLQEIAFCPYRPMKYSQTRIYPRERSTYKLNPEDIMQSNKKEENDN